MATISIHRALTIVAKANSSISTQIRSGLFIGTVIGASKRPSDRSFKTVEELQKRIQSDTGSCARCRGARPVCGHRSAWH